MGIVESTRRYDDWQSSLITIVPEDREKKHNDMAADEMAHLRATYYRWAELFPLVCPELAELLAVLSAGDQHFANFGTYRDAEARLNLANNDKDEAWKIAWPNDIVRLGASTLFIPGMNIGFDDICEAIKTGYGRGLEHGPMPLVLSEKHAKLHTLAHGVKRGPRPFWAKILALPEAKRVPASAREALLRALPADIKDYTIYTRTAGEGSLGRQRFVIVAHYKGGWIARECKRNLPSAHAMLEGLKNPANYYMQLVEDSADWPDPFLHIDGEWIVRRLSHDCCKFDLAQLEDMKDSWVLLKSFGRAILNLHGKDPRQRAKIQREFEALPKNWLKKGSQHMAEEVRADFRKWRRHQRSKAAE